MANHLHFHNISNRSLVENEKYLLQEFDIGRCIPSVCLIFFSLLTNSIVVISYSLNHKMRTTTNTMVLNHCLVDILLALSDIAFYLTPAYIPRLTNSYLFCELSVSLDSLLKGASILSMSGIAIDRYINLVRPSRKKMTKKQTVASLIWCWMQSTIVAIPWHANSLKHRSENSLSQLALVCHTLPRLFEAGMPSTALSIFHKTVCVMIPQMCIYYVSCQVFSALRRRRRVKIRDSLLRVTTWPNSANSFVARAQTKSPITAMVLFLLYVLCTAPFVVAIVWTMLPENQVLSSGVAFTVYFFFRLKGSLFPVLYILRNRVVLNSLQRFTCCLNFSRFQSCGISFDKRNSGINSSGWNCVTSKQIATKGFRRREPMRKESSAFYSIKSANVELNFTDLKTATGDSS